MPSYTIVKKAGQPITTPLIDHFVAIPEGTTELNASNIDLSQFSMQEIREAFLQIPSMVVSLDLMSCNLGALTDESLTAFWACLPNAVTILYLDSNQLGKRGAQAFTAFPVQIRELSFSNNFDASYNIDNFAEIIRQVCLDLLFFKLESRVNTSSPGIFALSTEILQRVFAAVSSIAVVPQKKSLRLSIDPLQLQGNINDLEAKLRLIPTNVTRLQCISGQLLTAASYQLFSTLPQGVQLHFEFLQHYDMQRIPQNITSLSFSVAGFSINSRLCLVENKHDCIPPQITDLQLSGLNGLRVSYTDALPPPLPQIKTLRLYWSELVKLPLKTTQVLSSRFPNLESLHILNDNHKPKFLSSVEKALLQNCGFSLGRTIPTLFTLAAMAALSHKEALDKSCLLKTLALHKDNKQALQRGPLNADPEARRYSIHEALVREIIEAGQGMLDEGTFIRAFTDIPQGAHRVSAINVALGQRSVDTICQAFAQIPATVGTLGLSFAELSQKSNKERVLIFNSIPKTVTRVYFERGLCHLPLPSDPAMAAGRMQPEEYSNAALILRDLSDHLEEVHICDSGLFDLSKTQLHNLCGMAPKHITFVIGNLRFPDATLLTKIRHLPSNVPNVTLFNYRGPDSSLNFREEFRELVQALPTSVTKIGFALTEYTRTWDITENPEFLPPQIRALGYYTPEIKAEGNKVLPQIQSLTIIWSHFETLTLEQALAWRMQFPNLQEVQILHDMQGEPKRLSNEDLGLLKAGGFNVSLSAARPTALIAPAPTIEPGIAPTAKPESGIEYLPVAGPDTAPNQEPPIECLTAVLTDTAPIPTAQVLAESSNPPCLSMQDLSILMMVLGVGAVVLAFVALNVLTGSIAGIMVAGAGVVSIVTGGTLFAIDAKNSSDFTVLPEQAGTHAFSLLPLA